MLFSVFATNRFLARRKPGTSVFLLDAFFVQLPATVVKKKSGPQGSEARKCIGGPCELALSQVSPDTSARCTRHSVGVKKLGTNRVLPFPGSCTCALCQNKKQGSRPGCRFKKKKQTKQKQHNREKKGKKKEKKNKRNTGKTDKSSAFCGVRTHALTN